MTAKKPISALLAVLLAFVCAGDCSAADKIQSVYSSAVISAGSVRMIAHRGYSSIAPENTLPAFREAGRYGFWGAECDISPTKDGVWVIMHDETVDRTTDGKGKVADFTLDEIRELTVDSGSNVRRYPGTKVPTLVEYLDVCKKYGMHPVIEIKTCSPVEAMDSLAALLRSREEKDMFTVITFGQEHAKRIKQLLPETPVYLLLGGGPDDDLDAAINCCLDGGLDGIDFAYVWKENDVGRIKEAGLKTMVWTVDDVDTAEKFYKMGVRDFTTNTLTQQRLPGNALRRFIRRLQALFNSFRLWFAVSC